MGIEKCVVCDKTVYPTERISVDAAIFHKTCFRCEECGNTLRLANYASLKGKYYCKPHFKQLFRLKGNYDEGFGHEQHKKKWLNGGPNEDEDDPSASSSVPITRLVSSPNLSTTPLTFATSSRRSVPDISCDLPAADLSKKDTTDDTVSSQDLMTAAVIGWVNTLVASRATLFGWRYPVPVTQDGATKSLEDGLVLCYLINAITPQTIDTRTVSEKPGAVGTRENLTLVLSSANAIGCDTDGITIESISDVSSGSAIQLCERLAKVYVLNRVETLYEEDTGAVKCSVCRDDVHDKYYKFKFSEYCSTCVVKQSTLRYLLRRMTSSGEKATGSASALSSVSSGRIEVVVDRATGQKRTVGGRNSEMESSTSKIAKSEDTSAPFSVKLRPTSKIEDSNSTPATSSAATTKTTESAFPVRLRPSSTANASNESDSTNNPANPFVVKLRPTSKVFLEKDLAVMEANKIETREPVKAAEEVVPVAEVIADVRQGLKKTGVLDAEIQEVVNHDKAVSPPRLPKMNAESKAQPAKSFSKLLERRAAREAEAAAKLAAEKNGTAAPDVSNSNIDETEKEEEEREQEQTQPALKTTVTKRTPVRKVSSEQVEDENETDEEEEESDHENDDFPDDGRHRLVHFAPSLSTMIPSPAGGSAASSVASSVASSPAPSKDEAAKAKLEADAALKHRKEEEERARKEEEERAKKEAEAKRKEEEKAKKEAEQRRREEEREAEQKRKAEEKAKKEAAAKLKEEEERAKKEAAARKKEEEERAKKEAETKRKDEEKAKKEAARLKEEEEERSRREETKRKREAEEAEEAKRQAKEEAEQKRKLEQQKEEDRLRQERVPAAVAVPVGGNDSDDNLTTKAPGDFTKPPVEKKKSHTRLLENRLSHKAGANKSKSDLQENDDEVSRTSTPDVKSEQKTGGRGEDSSKLLSDDELDEAPAHQSAAVPKKPVIKFETRQPEPEVKPQPVIAPVAPAPVVSNSVSSATNSGTNVARESSDLQLPSEIGELAFDVEHASLDALRARMDQLDARRAMLDNLLRDLTSIPEHARNNMVKEREKFFSEKWIQLQMARDQTFNELTKREEHLPVTNAEGDKGCLIM